MNLLNESDSNSKDKEDYIQFELSNNEIIKEEFNILTKYPNSILSACFNKKVTFFKVFLVFLYEL